MLRKHNVKLAVSTDLNPGSSPVYDLLGCATLACIIQGLTVEEAIMGKSVIYAKFELCGGGDYG
jgi:imidazolonepropionase